MAVDLAARDGARGLILENTFTSIPDVIDHHAGGMPIGWLFSTRLDSLAKIHDYHGPLLQTHGDADRLRAVRAGRKAVRRGQRAKALRPGQRGRAQRLADARIPESAGPLPGDAAARQGSQTAPLHRGISRESPLMKAFLLAVSALPRVPQPRQIHPFRAPLSPAPIDLAVLPRHSTCPARQPMLPGGIAPLSLWAGDHGDTPSTSGNSSIAIRIWASRRPWPP